MPALIPLQTALLVVALSAIAAIAVGVVIALLASRKAPDGYEDQGGFHVVRKSETFVDGLKTYGWLLDDTTDSKPTQPPGPQAS